MKPDLTLRYYVFSFDRYYPNGGLSDVVFTTNHLAEAEEIARGCKGDFVSIFDRIQGVIHDEQTK